MKKRVLLLRPYYGFNVHTDAHGEEYIEAECCSVYEGVDRDVFKGDTAITEDTLKRMSTKDEFNITDQDPFIAGISAMIAVALVSHICWGRSQPLPLRGMKYIVSLSPNRG